jgi:hypothetical protein
MMSRGWIAVALLLSATSAAQSQGIPDPTDFFGFEIGADRKLADWDQLTRWYELLAANSARVTVDTLGATTLGLPFVMLTVTDPTNHARLEELQDIQLRLADPRRVRSSTELGGLLDEGKTVVLVTHGIHATEVGGPQMAARLLYRLATSDDEKVLEILNNVILLDIPSLNPDGLRMVVDWYRQWVGTEYEAAPLPTLYHYYVGHDNNRDWYAFTQVETQLTVAKAHNEWHPQIVHDIHQTGSTGARIVLPPFIDPWEPNIDPLLTSAVNQLGAYMAAEILSQGKPGVVINAVYDAFTPARAYQHYHGGARILSETASARLATPITIGWQDLEARRSFDPTERAWNFPEVWGGGEWHLSDIVDYMEAGVMALLSNAARNRRYWLENFYRINERATARWSSWPVAWIIPAGQPDQTAVDAVVRILTLGDVEVRRAENAFNTAGRTFPAGSYVVPMTQPYASFAQTMLSRQAYPDLRQYPGGPPQPPYDVTGHTLPLLMGVEAVECRDDLAVRLSEPIPDHDVVYEAPPDLRGARAPRIAVYKSWREPIPEGWTRWVLDQHGIAYDTLHDAAIQEGALEDYDVLLLEDQSAEQIRGGYPIDQMPPEFGGGLGEAGTVSVRSFVASGGRVVAVGEATDFVIGALGIDIANSVSGLEPEDFYIPGSILRLEVESGQQVTEGVADESVAWFWRSSRAFDISDARVVVLARYGAGNPLLSGWVLGHQHVAGKPALVEASVGQGSAVLFGFSPNYRGQSLATWPLLFNALTYRR